MRSRPTLHLCLLALLCARLVPAAVRAADAPPERMVELPPLMVSEPVNGPPWRYVAAPGIEVLSRCSDEVTVHWLEEMNRLRQSLNVLVPDSLRSKRAVPDVVVLYNEENKPVVSKEVVADLMRDARDRTEEKQGRRGGATGYRSMPNLWLADRDSMVFFYVLQERGFVRSELRLTPDYVRYLARSRTPAPPMWFVEGMVDLFSAGDFGRDPVVFDTVEWDSPAATKNIKRDVDYPRSLLPLADLFATWPPQDPNGALRRREAALFLRWALDGKNQPRRPALLKFIAQASMMPVTEDLFRECFGLGYVDVQERLADYLSDATGKTLVLIAGEPVALPRLNPRLATDLEVARMKGDWERMEISYIKDIYPQLAPKYAEQARRTLMNAYDKGERDPQLLGMIGLCEVDAGNDAEARKYLEAAVQGGVTRPRVGYELARLRYAEAKAEPGGTGGRLSAAQATMVLQPLLNVYHQAPPMLEIYALSADVWSHSAPALTRQNLVVLDEGMTYFPRNLPLIYQAAWLNARQGFKTEAERIIARGLMAGPDAAFQQRLEQLRASLAAAPAAPPSS
ncbi:MAG TPA: hypothetical protein VG838_09840 [Opitutaceae bacterium]|nr:hypothetical protein [Opitutaceae bacterium]